MNKRAKIGVILAVSGCIFSLAETIYFGSSFLPQSDAEGVCDLIGFSMTLAGCCIFNSN
jgi:hypothetical protein